MKMLPHYSVPFIAILVSAVLDPQSFAGTTSEGDFNAGSITDAFNVNIHSGANPYSLAGNGIAGSQGLDLNASGTDDTTLVFKNASFNPATLTSIEMSCYIKKQATTAGTEAVSLGLAGALATKLTGYNDTATLEDCWARLRLVRNVNALRFEVQSKGGATGSGTTHVLGSNLPLTDGAWYHLSATFTRLSATQMRISGVLREADASGAIGPVVATQANTDITIADLAGDTQVYAALRGYGPAGADAWDNFSITANASGETAPTAPSSLTVTNGPAGRVLLGWADSSTNEDGFVISRSTTAGGSYSDVSTLRANVTSYVDPVSGVTPWFYKVRAFNSGGSASSAPAAFQSPYLWKNVTVGGGGYVTGVYLHPLEANLTYLRTDVGGVYRWDAANARWLPLTDHFGVDDFNLYGCSGFALDPQSTNVIYMAAGKSLATAGVMYKSTDRGASWTRLALANVEMHGNSTTRNGGERLVVSPFDSNIVLYGSHSDGLQRSSDGGTTWAQVAGFPGTLTAGVGITAIAFDPTTTGVVYAAAHGDAVCRSTDSGATWTKLAGGPAQVNRLVVAPGGTLLATHQSGVAKYASGSWTLTTPAGANPMCGLAVNPASANDVIVAEAETNTSVTYRSSDGGSTWASLPRSSTNTVPWQDGFRSGNPHIAALAFDPATSGRLWLTDWYGVWRTNNINAATPNFTNEAAGLEEVVTFALHAPSSGPLLLSGVADNNGFRHGALASFDAFPSARYDGFVAETYSIASCASDPLKLVRGCGGRNGLWRVFNSTDGGVNWTETSWNSSLGNTARPLRVAMSATNAQNVLVIVDGGTARRTTDGGSTWQTVSGLPAGPAGPFYFGQPLASDSVTGGRFYYHEASTGAVYRSTDAGGTFVQVNSGSLLPTSTFATKLKPLPGVADELWVCLDSGGLYRSTNGGANFTKINSVSRAYTFAFGKAPTGNPNPALYVYGSVSGQNGFLFRSFDLGSTWTDIGDPTAAIGNAPHVMDASMQQEGLVFLGTNGRGIYAGVPLGPEIAVEQPAGTDLADNNSTIFFGNKPVNDPAFVERVITIRNAGTADLTGITASIATGPSTAFMVGSPTASTLAPGASATLTVSFSPTTTGTHSATLQITSNDADENPFEIGLSGDGTVPDIEVFDTGFPGGIVSHHGNVNLGSVNVGQSQLRILDIRNQGTAPLTGIGISVTGGDPAFSISTLPVTTLAPGAVTSVTITFAPTSAGNRIATIMIGCNDPDEPFTEVNLMGVGAEPDISVSAGGFSGQSGGVLNLGTVTPGPPGYTFFITIQNTGNADLNGISINGVSPPPFGTLTMSTPPQPSLMPFGSTMVGITFQPIDGNPYASTIQIMSNDPDENPFEIHLAANGAVPEIGVQQPSGTDLVDGVSSVSFGNVSTGSSSAKTFTILNTGTAHLTGLAVTKNGSHPVDFTIGALSSSYISPGGSMTFTVTFAPSASGTRSAAIHVLSDDADESSFDIALTGTSADTTGPSGGSMTVAPATTVDPLTTLTVNFSGWTDPQTPLSYEVLLDNVVVSAQGITASRSLTSPATAGAHVIKGRIYDALNNVTEVTQSLTVNTLSQSWLQTHFGTSTPTGNAAPSADPNKNGIPNIIEYALGGDPVNGTTGQDILPDVGINPAAHCAEFSLVRHLDRNDITLTVQAADTLVGPWTNLARSVNGTAFTVLALGAAVTESGSGSTRSVTVCDVYQTTDPSHPRRFLRLEVSQ